MVYFKKAPSHKEEPSSGVFAKPIRTEEKVVIVNGKEMVMPVKIYEPAKGAGQRVYSICAALCVDGVRKPIRNSGG